MIKEDYTNRRRVAIPSADNLKTIEERKIENEQEFENVRLQIQQCSISKSPSKRKSFTRKSPSSSVLSASSCSSSYPEVEEFQKFLDNSGGHYGGWKVKDHLFFVKTRSKYPLNKTAEIVHESFPDISIDCILAHDSWYNEYVRLKSANKRAIEEWKKTQKPAPVKVVEKQTPEPKPQSAPIKRDPNMKQKIEMWKAHCLSEKLKIMKEQQEEEERRRKEKDERKKLQEERRALVNRYKEEKLSYEMALKTAEEVEKLQARRDAVRKTAALLKYFRYEDRRFTERQKAMRQRPTKDEPRAKSCVQVKRDPNRLLQPTLGWIYHTKKTGEPDNPAAASPLYIQHLRHLGKPAWRRGIST